MQFHRNSIQPLSVPGERQQPAATCQGPYKIHIHLLDSHPPGHPACALPKKLHRPTTPCFRFYSRDICQIGPRNCEQSSQGSVSIMESTRHPSVALVTQEPQGQGKELQPRPGKDSEQANGRNTGCPVYQGSLSD
ncbi:hypothetical protein VTK26DRAFT_8012 [Humicola hyalothermophila]